MSAWRKQNLINVSAGIGARGVTSSSPTPLPPFITMRCYEQIRVNLALLSEVGGR